ncbi:hypothetical protein Golomagni_06389 [Golovinomyces magnicellulatus]|nr:hypothetical protein Golomagni_06389 [Golovinomyces magnicellulatus]
MFISKAIAAATLLIVPVAVVAEEFNVNKQSAQDVVKKLGLQPNVEKGYYTQTFEDPVTVEGNRSASTLIYYLLEGKSGDSVWHRVTDATEVWHYYAGAPLTLSLSNNTGKAYEKHLLGQDFFHGQSPQVVIPRNTWQSAKSHGDWTLVGNTADTNTDSRPGFLYRRI